MKNKSMKNKRGFQVAADMMLIGVMVLIAGFLLVYTIIGSAAGGGTAQTQEIKVLESMGETSNALNIFLHITTENGQDMIEIVKQHIIENDPVLKEEIQETLRLLSGDYRFYLIYNEERPISIEEGTREGTPVFMTTEIIIDNKIAEITLTIWKK
jgi:hypothetical protein